MADRSNNINKNRFPDGQNGFLQKINNKNISTVFGISPLFTNNKKQAQSQIFSNHSSSEHQLPVDTSAQQTRKQYQEYSKQDLIQLLTRQDSILQRQQQMVDQLLQVQVQEQLRYKQDISQLSNTIQLQQVKHYVYVHCVQQTISMLQQQVEERKKQVYELRGFTSIMQNEEMKVQVPSDKITDRKVGNGGAVATVRIQAVNATMKNLGQNLIKQQ